MRVLVLAQSGGVGGVESSLSNFVRYAVSRGDDVTVVFWRDSGPTRESLPAVVRVIDIQKGFAGRIYRTGGIREALSRGGVLERLHSVCCIMLRRALRECRNPWILLNRIPERFDVAVAFRHQGYAPYYLVDKVTADKKVMWFHHGSYSASPMGYRVDRRYFEKMNQIVAVSNWTRDVILRSFPTLDNRVTVIGNIIDGDEILRKAEMTASGAERSGVLTLVTVSRLSEEKGLDIAVETASILQRRGLDFVWRVVGDGPERSRIERLIVQKDVADRFVLLGERENPFPYVRASDIYVQTSRVEAYGLAIAEAIVMGKPVVASAIPSAEEVLSGGDYGVLCRLTPESFADGISAIASGGLSQRDDAGGRSKWWQSRNAEIEREIDVLLDS